MAIERETLLETRRTGQILVLLDGRKLRVHPEYTPSACLWMPTESLEISDKSVGESVDVTNLGTGERIAADWID